MRDDELARDLAALAAPRALPPGLRDRLEATLLDGRPVPERVAAAVVVAQEHAAFAGLDAPRPVPAHLRARLEAALLDAPRVTPARRLGWFGGDRARALVASAAAFVLLAGVAAVTVLPGDRTSRQHAPGARPAPPAVTATAPVSAVPSAPGPLSINTPGATARPGRDQSPAAPAAGDPAGPNRYDGPPPPFTTAMPAAAPAAPAAPGSAPTATKAPQPARVYAPLVVAVAGGDDGQAAGLRAYVSLLNETGGINGRPVHLAAPGERTAIVTVNLDPAAGPAGGPVLESLAATEDRLRGNVFSFASAPERQARLIAAEVFPDDSPGATAILYTEASGVFASRVPDAMEAVLEARGVAVARVTYRPGEPPLLLPGDAAFLSLHTASAAQWLEAARQAGYRTTRGIAGIYTLHDAALGLPNGTRVMSPYLASAGRETATLESRSGRPAGAATMHGWVTAKSLAFALWRTHARTQAEVASAIRGLRGFYSGFAPPYEVRPGTNSRTPEAVLLVARDGRLAPRGGFRTDRFQED